MRQTSVEFLATKEEIPALIDWFRSGAEMVVVGAYPGDYETKVLLRPGEPVSRLEGCKYLYLKLGTEFSEENCLFFHLGSDDGNSIRESGLGLKGEGAEFDYWKKQLARFRRTLRHGLWCADPELTRWRFYRNASYTDGALAAYQRGVKLMPAAGRNVYLLEEPQPNK